VRPEVVIVGAGISGLAAAHAIGPAAHVTVLDGANRLGGKLFRSEVGGLVVDAGAEAMLARSVEGIELATAVGLADQLVHPATSSASLVIGGALRPIPGGTLMGIPADLEAVRAAGVLSDQAMVRLEQDVPGPPLGDDVAVGSVVGSRLGREVVDRLVDPLLGGVYAGRADVLSLQATVPALARALRLRGSVVAAARAAVAAAPRREGPVFATLRLGLGSLPEAVARASGADIRLGLPVREVVRTATGFQVLAGPVPSPTVLHADAVIVAAPAPKASRMLAAVAPRAAYELSRIEYASTALVTLAYRDVEFPPGSGALVPASEGYDVKALTFSSQKWPHLAGEHTIVRASIGRHGDAAPLQVDDDELVVRTLTEVASITGVCAVPIDSRVTRWGGALPQYAIGHLDRVRRIRADVDRVPGLAVCGAAYDGVGVPACIRTGQQAAARVLADVAARVGSDGS
jgi:oxygen-dependent protoporphyrinogen oxidase